MEELLPERFQRHKNKNMEIKAESKFIKVSPRKLRLVAKNLRGLNPVLAMEKLMLLQKDARSPLLKTLKSVISNATNNLKLNTQSLRIKKVEINQGGAFKRFHPAARGRTHPYKKRMSHIKIVLEEINGTKS